MTENCELSLFNFVAHSVVAMETSGKLRQTFRVRNATESVVICCVCFLWGASETVLESQMMVKH